jgi:broad specificity phosphatase PhoE
MFLFSLIASLFSYIYLLWAVLVCALPHQIFFFSVWIFASLWRPFVWVTGTYTCVVHPVATLRKLSLLATSIQYLLLCQDKKFRLPKEDPVPQFPDVTTAEHDPTLTKRTILFLRHGESTWNDTFNKGNDRSTFTFVLYFLPNLMTALATEFYFSLTGQADESWFFDSPLSPKGIQQAVTVHTVLRDTSLDYLTPKEQALWTILRDPNTLCVASNLRRAVATAALALPQQQRLVIHAALQEISRNPDAFCISPAGRILPGFTDPPSLRSLYATADRQRLDATAHTGNKPCTQTGRQRVEAWAQWVFHAEQDREAMIVVGHSLWFQTFFWRYLPAANTHISKRKKLQNGSIIGFTLWQKKGETEQDASYIWIDPASMVVVHGGF